MQYSFEAMPNTQEITSKFLENIGLNCFVYCKIYLNGSRMYLTNHEAWLHKYIDNEFFNSTGHVQSYWHGNPEGYAFWSGYKQDDVFKAAAQLDICHGFTIYQRQKDHCEAFLFGAPSDNYQITNFYVNHLQLLKKFITQFKNKAKDILDVTTNRVLVPSANTQDKIAKILHNSVAPSFDNNIKLTFREKESLYWAARGKTIWETAKILGVVESTVNEYLANSIRKLGAANKVEAVAKAIVSGCIN